MPSRQGLPRPFLASVPALRRWYARRAARCAADPDRFDPAVRRFLDATLLPERFGHEDFDGDGVPDGFRIALTNAGAAQRVDAVRVAVDGVVIDAERLRVDNGFAVFRASALTRARFEPGVPFVVTVLGQALAPGVHLVSLRLVGEVEDVHLVGLPLVVEPDAIRPAIFPADSPSAEACVSPPIHVIPYATLGAVGRADPETALAAGLGVLLDAMRIASREPGFTFAFGDARVVDEMEARRPESFVELARLVREGRFEFTVPGGVDVDPFSASGETLARLVVEQQRRAVERFGRPCRSGFWLETCALAPQMPQLLLKAGVDRLVTIGPARETRRPAFFWFRGADRARIAVHRLVVGARAAYPIHSDADRTLRRWEGFIRETAERAHKKPAALALGAPLGRPQAEAVETVAAWNARHPFAPMRLSTPRDLFDDTDRAGAPTFDARPALVRPPTLRARDFTRMVRRAEAAILDLETLSLFDSGDRRLDEEIARIGREYLALLDDAVLSGRAEGSAADEVERRLHKARREAEDSAAWRLSRLEAPPEDGPTARRAVVVANALGFVRQEAVEAWVEARRGRLPVLHDGRRILPTQVLELENDADGRPRRARVAFLAHAPACGFRVYDLADEPGELEPPHKRFFARAETEVLENGFVRVEINPVDATLRSVWDRKSGVNFPLGDASRPARIGAPWLAALSRRDRRARVLEASVIENGPVWAAVRFRAVWRDKPLAITYRLTQGGRHVEALIDWPEGLPDGGLDWRFDTDLRRGRFEVETAFSTLGVREGFVPTQGYVRLHDGERGLVWLGEGLPVWTRRRGRVSARFEPRPTLDAGPYRLGVYPHVGPVEKDNAWKRAQAFSRPLTAIGPRPAIETGAPRSMSLLRLDPGHALLTSLRPAGDDVEARLHEAAGLGGEARLALPPGVEEVRVTDLLGRDAKRYAVENRTVAIPLGAFEIKTLRWRRS